MWGMYQRLPQRSRRIRHHHSREGGGGRRRSEAAASSIASQPTGCTGAISRRAACSLQLSAGQQGIEVGLPPHPPNPPRCGIAAGFRLRVPALALHASPTRRPVSDLLHRLCGRTLRCRSRNRPGSGVESSRIQGGGADRGLLFAAHAVERGVESGAAARAAWCAPSHPRRVREDPSCALRPVAV